MATGLLALLDDLTTVLDDIAAQTKAPIQKTAGVVGDDLALNANQVTGLAASRELPVVFAILKGSLINKVILVPLAFLISQYLPILMAPLLIIGGAYLCFEGVEKIAHKLFHAKEEADHVAEVKAAAHVSAEELMKVEQGRIKGAIRTDFVLSAEIVFIMLSALSHLPASERFIYLSSLSLVMTFVIYGVVALIVKMDDFGFFLQSRANPLAKKLGAGIITAVPYFMRLLSVAGTVAMFLVGGELITHNVAALHHWIEDNVAPGLMTLLANITVGITTGIVLVAALETVNKLKTAR